MTRSSMRHLFQWCAASLPASVPGSCSHDRHIHLVIEPARATNTAMLYGLGWPGQSLRSTYTRHCAAGTGINSHSQVSRFSVRRVHGPPVCEAAGNGFNSHSQV
jgi:hypothetical protein